DWAARALIAAALDLQAVGASGAGGVISEEADRLERTRRRSPRAQGDMRLMAGALLLQPHGSEGLRVIPEELVADDPSVPNRGDVSELHVRAGHLTRRVPDEPHQGPVTGIDEVPDRLRRVRIPGVAEALELTHDGVSTYLGSRLRPTAGSVHDDARVEQLAERIHVACVPRRKEGMQDRDILLRHRLLLQPHGCEGGCHVGVAHDREGDLALAHPEGVGHVDLGPDIAALAYAIPARVADDPGIGV